MFDSLLQFAYKVLYFLLCVFGVLTIPFILVFTIYFIGSIIGGKRLKKRTIKRAPPKYSKKDTFLSLIYKIYILVPIRIIKDMFESNPDVFKITGVHVFCGEQGTGKTISAVHFCKRLKEIYPLAEVGANINLDFKDFDIQGIDDIISNLNGEKGQINLVDEVQNWFSSANSKNFPPSMLTEITQQRKQRKCLVCTSQVFTRMSKPIREQVTFLYKPITFFGCFTWVRVYKPNISDDGLVDKSLFIRSYCFVHDDYLRSCYDTFERVKVLGDNIKKVGIIQNGKE